MMCVSRPKLRNGKKEGCFYPGHVFAMLKTRKETPFLGGLRWSRPRTGAENQLDRLIDQPKRMRIQIGAEALGMEAWG